jgi:hypothetical protein
MFPWYQKKCIHSLFTYLPKAVGLRPSVEMSDGRGAAEDVDIDEQVPKLARKPVLQWADVEPQKLLGLQQSPGESV